MFRFLPSRETAFALFLMLMASACFLCYAVGGIRAAQLWCFLLPSGLLFAAADGRRGLAKPAAWFLGISCLISNIDTGLRGYLMDAYQSTLNSDFIIESVANTHADEAVEYFSTALFDVLFWAALACVTSLFQTVVLMRRIRCRTFTPVRWRVATLSAVTLCTLLAAASVAIKPWRNQFATHTWPAFYTSVLDFRASKHNLEENRIKETELAAAQVLPHDITPRTIVLVIGESITRDNMSLYGYSRNTTPKLEALAAHDKRFTFVKDAWSTQASTVASFMEMLDFKVPGVPDVQGNVIAYFRAAGYRITWISNQDDKVIRYEWMAHSNRQIVLNRLTGRSSRSMDEAVLAPLREAIADPAPLKLIVVHTIGAHPHFSYRYPAGLKPLWSTDDGVARSLKELDRPFHIRQSRNEYDLAMLYQDRILAETLALTSASSDRTPAAWIYLSDHGMETGTYDDRVGHSRTTPAGYRIPLLLWADPRLSKDWAWTRLSKRSFRSDWTPGLLFDAAGIRIRSAATPSILSEHYRWEPPASKTRFDIKK